MSNQTFKPVIKLAEVQAKYVRSIDFETKTRKIGGSRELERFIRPFYDRDQIAYRESFFAMYFSRANEIISVFKCSEGGVSGCFVDAKLILAQALIAGASGIAVCHNHPSGNLYPSDADKKLTIRLKEACSFMDMILIDHIILTPNSYFSFMDDGIL